MGESIVLIINDTIISSALFLATSLFGSFYTLLRGSSAAGLYKIKGN